MTDRGVLTATDVALCTRMDPERRAAWARDGILTRCPPFQEQDAIETAVAQALLDATNNQRARAALLSIRAELRKLVLASKVNLWAVVPNKGTDIAVVEGASAAARAAYKVGRPVRMVPLEGDIAAAREAWATRTAAGHVGEVLPIRPDIGQERPA
jgi:hypothetical protein